MVISSLIWIVFGITIAYLFVIGIITYGWFSLSTYESDPKNSNGVTISVVIAVRNESANIETLLKQLVNQSYDIGYFEIIVVDDHSTDNTAQLVNQFISDNSNVKIELVTASGEGKKNAIREGIATSSAQLIVTTDGDCKVVHHWLQSIVNYYVSSGCKLILGPVVYENEKTFLQQLFSLDFASLVASGAGSAGAGLPLMGNGANLAFSRDVFNAVNSNTDKFASGDDVFLIHNVTRKYGAKAIGFLRSKDGIVSTLPPVNLTDFLRQRTRWASKAVGYRLVWPVIVPLTVFLFNLLLFIMLFGSLWFPWLLPVYFLIIITKFVIDAPLVFSFLSFTEKTNLKPLLFLMEFIYPVYIIISAIASFLFRFEWKGRERLR